ncbi:MAG: TIGR04283 family arsenosugar biosynthesis glycosyltransferase [Methyloligellaceae bacterium]
MISVVIPTLNPDKRFAVCLSALVPAVVKGIVKDVIVVDGGSEGTLVSEICDAAGVTLVTAEKGRGTQLAAGARKARGKWLLFLHADTILEHGWEQEAGDFIEKIEMAGLPQRAGAFQFALDDFGMMPRILERLVGLRCGILKLPYGDQGLLISQQLYKEIGGYQDIPLMEDVDIIRRLGRRRLVMFRNKAVTNAARFNSDGYIVRMAKNVTCLMMYYLKVPTRIIQRLYG